MDHLKLYTKLRGLITLVLLMFVSSGSLTFAQSVSYTENTSSTTLFDNPTTYSSSTAYYRIPAITKDNSGNLWAFSDLRVGGSGDIGTGSTIHIVVKKSTDNGASWGDQTVIIPGGGSDFEANHGDAAVVTDSETGKMLLLCASGTTGYSSGGCSLGQYTSTNGTTWTGSEITTAIKSAFTTAGLTISKQFFTSGRIVQSSKIKVGSSYRIYTAMCTNAGSVVMYSDDFGSNWAVLGSQAAYSGGDETVLEELPNGDLLLSARLSGSGRGFAVYNYSDISTGTGSWSSSTATGLSSATYANGEMLLVPTSDSNYYVLLHSVALSGRTNVTVYYKVINTSDTYNVASYYSSGWNVLKQMSTTTSCYSTMTFDENGNVAYLWEDNANGGYDINYRNFTVNFTNTSILDNAVAGTNNFSTSSPSLTINDSGNSTITTSGTSYVVSNTTNSLATQATTNRTLSTIAMVIDFPTTLTAGNIFTMSTGGTITASGSCGLAVNSSGYLQGKYMDATYYTPACTTQYTGKHVVIVTENDNGWTIYVDGTQVAQETGLKVSNLWQYMTIDAAYADYIEQFYVFNDDETSNVATINAALSAETYTVTCNTATGGTVTADAASAVEGKSITLTVTPNAGYSLASLTVTDASSTSIGTTDNGDGTYSFTMPGSNVTVDATFEQVTTFKLKTSGDIDTSKKYLIVYQASADATEGSLMSSSFTTNAYNSNQGTSVGSTATISSNTISTAEANSFSFESTGSDGVYYIKNNAGYYFGNSTSYYWFAVSNTTGFNNTVSFNDSNIKILGAAQKTSSVDMVLFYDSSSSKESFYYKPITASDFAYNLYLYEEKTEETYSVGTGYGTFSHADCNNTSSTSYYCKWTSTEDSPTLTMTCAYADLSTTLDYTNLNNMAEGTTDGEFLAYSANTNSSTYTAEYTLSVPEGYKIVSYSFDYEQASGTTLTVLDNNSTEYTSGSTVSVNAQTAKFYVQGASSTMNYETISNFNVVIAPATLSSITCNTATGGTVTASSTTAYEGSTVTLTITPDENYSLKTLTVTDANGNAVEVSDTYTFTMPASAVTVNATFDSSIKTFALKTSGEIDTDKRYLIVYQTSADAASGTMMSSDFEDEYVGSSTSSRGAEANSTAATIASGKITTDISNAFTFSNSSTDGKYYIKNYAGYYFGNSLTYQNFVVSNTDGIDNNVTISSTGEVSIFSVNSSSVYLKYYTNSSSTCFKYTTSSTAVLPYLYEEESDGESITCNTATGGTVTSDVSTAKEGVEVTLTVAANGGYELSTLLVKDADNTIVATTDKGDGTYTFTMPAKKVTVTAEFSATYDGKIVTLTCNGNTAGSNTKNADATSDQLYYRYIYNDGGTIAKGTTASTDEEYQFKMTKGTDGGYTFQSVSDETYYLGLDSNGRYVALSATATEFTLIKSLSNSSTTGTEMSGYALQYFATYDSSNKVIAVNNGTSDVTNCLNFTTDSYSTTYYTTDFTITEANVHSVTCTAIGGTITASPNSAEAGTTITLTNTPNGFYSFDTTAGYTVTDADGNVIDVTENAGTYTFTMPETNVTVTGTFNADYDGKIVTLKCVGTSFTDGIYVVNVGALATTESEPDPAGTDYTTYQFLMAKGATGGYTFQSLYDDTYLYVANVGSNVTLSTTANEFILVKEGGTSGTTMTGYALQYSLSDIKYICINSDGTFNRLNYTTDQYSSSSDYSTDFTIELAGPDAPVFSPASQHFSTDELDVTLTCSTEGATIYYTTDGTDPRTSDTRIEYTTAIKVTGPSTILAASCSTTGIYSQVVTATYDRPYAVTVSPLSVTLKKDATQQITVTADAGYTGTVTYTSLDPSIATVSSDGLITAISEGTVTIRVSMTAQDKYNTNDVDITVKVSASHIPTAYSTSWLTTNEIYLYNKATGLYLGTGGHWGTEGILKSTGLPAHMSKAAEDKSDVTGVTMYSAITGDNVAVAADSVHAWGYTSSAHVFGIENQGLYCDAGNNYLAQTFSFYYNSDDNSYSIVPDAMKDGVAIYFKPSTAVTLYLTPNQTKTSSGTYYREVSWATVPYYWTYDSENSAIYTVYGSSTSSAGVKYYLTYSADTLALTTSTSTATAVTFDGDYLTVGSHYLTGAGKNMTEDSSAASSLYALYQQNSNYKFYLEQNGGSETARQNIITARRELTTAIPDEARWFVITKQDLLDDFATATQKGSTAKEATFLLQNPDFSREVTQGWTLTNTTGTSSKSGVGSYTEGYIRIGNALFNYASPYTSVNNTYNSVEGASDGSVSTTTTDAPYGGNGTNYVLTSTDAAYANLPEGTKTYYNIPYGGYYNCRILGTSGTVSQSITVPKAGYYRVSCDAYVYNPTNAGATATLWAKQSGVTEEGKQNVSAEISSVSEFQDMTASGITFANNDDYRQAVTVYVNQDQTLDLGVTLTNGTLGSSAATSSLSTFVAIDEFKIEYTGAPEYDIILCDTSTSVIVPGTENRNYINAQVSSTAGARTMYLKRSMTADIWNSIVLPVDISVDALKAAFGDNVQLAAYDSIRDGNVVTFTKVDLSDKTATAIHAGTCYLVNPSKLNSVTGTFTSTFAKAPSRSISVSTEGDDKSPIFTFTQVTLEEELSDTIPATVGKFIPSTNAGDESLLYSLCFRGCYFKATEVVGYGSYILKNNEWIRYVNKSKNANIKGFRCWVGPDTDSPRQINSGDVKLIFSIDGEEMEATDIADLKAEQPEALTDNRVFNVSGQLVGTAENMNRLPKGIYITNGKKYIIK